MIRPSSGRAAWLWRSGPVLLGIVAGFPAEAAADPLRAGAEHPWVASVGMGPSFFLHDEGFAQPKLAQHVGVHLLGTNSGPAVGVGVEEAFGHGLLRIQSGLDLWWDIHPLASLPWSFAPVGRVGYAYRHSSFAGALSAFDAQIGLSTTMALDDHWIAYIRPVTLDLWATDLGVASFYDASIGAGVTF